MVQESLPNDCKDDVCRHIETCANCQASLDGLTEPAGIQPIATAISAEACRVLQRVKESGLPLPPHDSHDNRIRFPDPGDSDAPLGRIGRYCIVEEVGCGGTGFLFKAFDPELNRHVAVKVLRSELAILQSSRHRFACEGRAIAQIDSRNIVQVYEVGVESDFLPYLVMEYIEGVSLAELLAERQFVPWERAVEILIEMLSGLDRAHSNGVIHRDVKPANVLIDQSAHVKLVDFGLARLTDQSIGLTREGIVAGTPAYMSPEQIVSPQHVDERSDVYSAGVVLYEMLAGELPFRGVDQRIMHQVVHDEPRSPRYFNDRIPRDLENICLKAIAGNPAGRYQTASEFQEDLTRWQNNEPVAARAPGAVGRTVRWCRRHPLTISMCVIVAVLCCGLVGIWADFTFSLSEAHARLLRSHQALRQSKENASLNEMVARSSAELAQGQANLSLRLIHELIFDIQDHLEANEATGELRASLLRTAIDGLDNVSEMIPDSGSLAEARAIALNRLGDAYRDLGDLKSARRSYAQAIELTSILQQSDPISRPGAARQLIRSHRYLAELLSSSDKMTARVHLDEVVNIGEQTLLHSELTIDQAVDILNDTSAALRQLADNASKDDKSEYAIDYLSRLAKIEQKVSAWNGRSGKYADGFVVRHVGTLLDIAELQSRLGRNNESLDSITVAQESLAALRGHCRTSCAYLEARCFDLSGRIAHESGDLQKARHDLIQADAKLTQEADRESLDALRLWCQSRINLALIDRESGDEAQARNYLNSIRSRLSAFEESRFSASDKNWKTITIEKVQSLMAGDHT